jgi:hypothetical protein
MKTYWGIRHENRVSVQVVTDDGRQEPLNPRFDLRNHSPCGFEWGYCGSGPAQLALALLADATGDDEVAETYYQDFKQQIVAGLNKEVWTLSVEDVKQALPI